MPSFEGGGPINAYNQFVRIGKEYSNVKARPAGNPQIHCQFGHPAPDNFLRFAWNCRNAKKKILLCFSTLLISFSVVVRTCYKHWLTLFYLNFFLEIPVVNTTVKNFANPYLTCFESHNILTSKNSENYVMLQIQL